MMDYLIVVSVTFVLCVLCYVVNGCFALKAWNPKKPKKGSKK